jgi:nucleotide-binding universal stress UspA family protein
MPSSPAGRGPTWFRHYRATVENETANTAAAPSARIVVGVDGSPSSISALRRGARIAAALELPLEAVTAWYYPELFGGYRGGYMGEGFIPDSADLIAGAQAMLDEAVQAVFGDQPPTGFHGSVLEGRAAQTLIEESKGAEMLIVGSRGHGGFTGLLLGSVSQACVEHATCPVLVLHGSESEGATP